jgi:hypothetical protein
MKTVLIIAGVALVAWFLWNEISGGASASAQVVQGRQWPNFAGRPRYVAPGTWYYGGRA